MDSILAQPDEGSDHDHHDSADQLADSDHHQDVMKLQADMDGLGNMINKHVNFNGNDNHIRRNVGFNGIRSAGAKIWDLDEMKSLVRAAERCCREDRASWSRPGSRWPAVLRLMREEGYGHDRTVKKVMCKLWCLQRSFKRIRAWKIIRDLQHHDDDQDHKKKKNTRRSSSRATTPFDLHDSAPIMYRSRSQGARGLPKFFDKALYDGLQRLQDAIGLEDGDGGDDRQDNDDEHNGVDAKRVANDGIYEGSVDGMVQQEGRRSASGPAITVLKKSRLKRKTRGDSDEDGSDDDCDINGTGARGNGADDDDHDAANGQEEKEEEGMVLSDHENDGSGGGSGGDIWHNVIIDAPGDHHQHHHHRQVQHHHAGQDGHERVHGDHQIVVDLQNNTNIVKGKKRRKSKTSTRGITDQDESFNELMLHHVQATSHHLTLYIEAVKMNIETANRLLARQRQLRSTSS